MKHTSTLFLATILLGCSGPAFEAAADPPATGGSVETTQPIGGQTGGSTWTSSGPQANATGGQSSSATGGSSTLAVAGSSSTTGGATAVIASGGAQTTTGGSGASSTGGSVSTGGTSPCVQGSQGCPCFADSTCSDSSGPNGHMCVLTTCCSVATGDCNRPSNGTGGAAGTGGNAATGGTVSASTGGTTSGQPCEVGAYCSPLDQCIPQAGYLCVCNGGYFSCGANQVDAGSCPTMAKGCPCDNTGQCDAPYVCHNATATTNGTCGPNN